MNIFSSSCSRVRSGAVLLSAVEASFIGGSSNEDVLLRNGHSSDDNTVLFAAGAWNGNSPRGPRIKDFNLTPQQTKYDMIAGDDPEQSVGPARDPDTGRYYGMSAFADPRDIPLTKVSLWAVKKAYVIATEGLGVEPDGQPRDSHHTIYPTRRMPAREFVDKVMSLPWAAAGQKP